MSKNSKLKKATALLLCGVAALSMAACGGDFRRDDSSEEYDPTKTYLNVGNYNGGLGYAWLREVADKYEAAHPDVKIKINNEKIKAQANKNKRAMNSQKINVATQVVEEPKPVMKESKTLMLDI